MIVDEGLELLTEDEAKGLLAGGGVGRIGITIGALPAIFPVNYRVVDGEIFFRTSEGSKMTAATNGSVVAFEVDDYQLEERSGWSVLAIGTAHLVDAAAPRLEVLDTTLAPLADGRRPALVCIEPTFISGRRIVHETQTTIQPG
jgi:nitroimidazol reductase NimA-like FMN-containing flavoprotein (pyridoxamine 5'-phosphate oxidase superfamily)